MFSKFLKTSSSALRLQFNQQRCFSYGNSDKISWTQEIRESQKSETVNPYFNPLAASMKAEVNSMQEQIREWQKDFKAKHDRKPTLEEMKKDPSIGPLFESIERQKNMMKATVQKWRIN